MAHSHRRTPGTPPNDRSHLQHQSRSLGLTTIDRVSAPDQFGGLSPAAIGAGDNTKNIHRPAGSPSEPHQTFQHPDSPEPSERRRLAVFAGAAG